MNVNATIGHNNPPNELFEEASQEIESLYEEAKHWLDGSLAKTQDEVDAISKLLDMFRKASKLTDENRKAEKKPHDDAGKEVQARYKPLLKKADDAQDLCKKAMQPFLLEQERVRKEQEELARQEAEQAEQEAMQAAHAAQSLADVERVSEVVQRADDAHHLVGQIEKHKVQAKGGSRAVGLRTVWKSEVTDYTLAARHFWQSHKAEFEQLVDTIAAREVRGGARSIPGVNITETKEI